MPRFDRHKKQADNPPMHARSMFAIYIYENEEGQLCVRADSYGAGAKAITLGIDALNNIIEQDAHLGYETMFMLPVDRSESIQ